MVCLCIQPFKLVHPGKESRQSTPQTALAREVKPLTSYCFISPSNTSIKNSLQHFCVAWRGRQQQGKRQSSDWGKTLPAQTGSSVRVVALHVCHSTPGLGTSPPCSPFLHGQSPSLQGQPAWEGCGQLCTTGMCTGGIGAPGVRGMRGGHWVCKVGTGCCHRIVLVGKDF